jgi:hypothetical protein
LIFIPKENGELDKGNVCTFVRNQAYLWTEMGIVGNITDANIAYTYSGFPVFIPHDENVVKRGAEQDQDPEYLYDDMIALLFH